MADGQDAAIQAEAAAEASVLEDSQEPEVQNGTDAAAVEGDAPIVDAKAEATEEPAEPTFDDKAAKEIQRLHGLLKASKGQIAELRQKAESLTAPPAPAKREAAPVVDDDDDGADLYGAPRANPEVEALKEQLAELRGLVTETVGTQRQRDLEAAQQHEDAIMGQMQTAALGSVTAFVSDLYPKGISPEATAEQDTFATDMARGEFLRIAEAEGLDDEGLLTPEIVQRVAVNVRNRYKAIGAYLGAQQIADNQKARTATKITPDAPTGTDAPTPYDKMGRQDQVHFIEGLAAAVNAKVGSG